MRAHVCVYDCVGRLLVSYEMAECYVNVAFNGGFVSDTAMQTPFPEGLRSLEAATIRLAFLLLG